MGGCCSCMAVEGFAAGITGDDCGGTTSIVEETTGYVRVDDGMVSIASVDSDGCPS
jgi:hypothetical protein